MPAGSVARCGQPVEHVEDAAHLPGRRRFTGDLGEPPGTLAAEALREARPHV
jgi:hypothetical protein